MTRTLQTRPSYMDKSFEAALERAITGVGVYAYRTVRWLGAAAFDHRARVLTVAGAVGGAFATVAFFPISLALAVPALALTAGVVARRHRAVPAEELSRVSLWDPIELGVDEAGHPVMITLPYRNLLIGGIPGSGKSVAMGQILKRAALDPEVKIVGIDAKRGVELWPWKDAFDAFATTPEAALRQMEHVRTVLENRLDQLREAGLKKITPDWPLWLIVIDELEMLTDNEARMISTEFNTHLRIIVGLGRAAGFICVAATQKPAGSTVPTRIRDLFAYALAFWSTTPDASDTILGRGHAHRGYDASTIGDNPGRGWLRATGGAPTLFQGHDLNEQDVAETMEVARKLRGVEK